MIFVTTETIEWEWERLSRVAALAGHCFACPSELESSLPLRPEHAAGSDMRRIEEGPRPAGEVVPFVRIR